MPAFPAIKLLVLYTNYFSTKILLPSIQNTVDPDEANQSILNIMYPYFLTEADDINSWTCHSETLYSCQRLKK